MQIGLIFTSFGLQKSTLGSSFAGVIIFIQVLQVFERGASISGPEWDEDANGAVSLAKCETEQVIKDGKHRSMDSGTVTESYSGTNGSLICQKRDDESIHLYATNKQVAKRLTTPKLTKHNDAAYYPNIQCLLCREWVCSRNR